MLLHHSSDSARGRGMLALHLPSEDVCYVWMVNPARGGQKEVSGPALDRAWSEMTTHMQEEHAEKQGDGEVLDLPARPRFEVAYARTEGVAFKAVQRLLNGIKDRARYDFLSFTNKHCCSSVMTYIFI